MNKRGQDFSAYFPSFEKTMYPFKSETCPSLTRKGPENRWLTLNCALMDTKYAHGSPGLTQ